MSLTTQINITASSGDITMTKQRTLEASGRVGITETVGSAASDLAIDAAVPNSASQIKFFALQAQVADMTVKLVDGAGTKIHASAEYSLAAGEIFIWPATDGETAPTWVDEGDIVQMLVTNDSDPAAEGVVVMSTLYDSTT